LSSKTPAQSRKEHFRYETLAYFLHHTVYYPRTIAASKLIDLFNGLAEVEKMKPSVVPQCTANYQGEKPGVPENVQHRIVALDLLI
jgi:hypothetical protein